MVQVNLLTSLDGLKNRINGRRVYAFTNDSPMRGTMDIIAVTVDLKDVESIDENGMITIKAKI